MSSRTLVAARWSLLAVKVCMPFLAACSSSVSANSDQTSPGRSDEVRPNPIALAFELSTSGEMAVLDRLGKSPREWNAVVSSVAGSEQSWLNIGLLLLPAAHGTQRTDLHTALEEALISDPIMVLGSFSSVTPSMRDICGLSAHPERDLADNSLQMRRDAVETALLEQTRALDSEMRLRMTKCADLLREASTEFERS